MLHLETQHIYRRTTTLSAVLTAGGHVATRRRCGRTLLREAGDRGLAGDPRHLAADRAAAAAQVKGVLCACALASVHLETAACIETDVFCDRVAGIWWKTQRCVFFTTLGRPSVTSVHMSLTVVMAGVASCVCSLQPKLYMFLHSVPDALRHWSQVRLAINATKAARAAAAQKPKQRKLDRSSHAWP